MQFKFGALPSGLSKENYHIHYVYSDDYAQVSELHTDFFEFGGPVDKTELAVLLNSLYNNNSAMIGLFEHNVLIGIANIQVVPKVHYQDKKPLLLKTAQIDNVIIHKDHRGKGLGKMLIKGVCKIAKDNGCISVSLYCNNYNVAFYEKCGFRHSSNQMRKTL